MRDEIEKTPPKSSDKKPDKRRYERVLKLLKSLVSTKKRRITTIVAVLVLVVAIIMTIPMTRYGVLGLVIKKDASILVVDSVTGKPVSEVDVTLAGKMVRTNSKGEANFRAVAVGIKSLKIEKKFFQISQQNLKIPLFGNAVHPKFSLKATGRQVLIKVVNKISSVPLEKAILSVSGTTATTNKNGEAAIVLPITTKQQAIKVIRDGYNEAFLNIMVADKADQKADVGLTPGGKVYFLSKRTGKINVVKSNLDGTDQQVVVQGTGQESDSQTVLLASRDWKSLAFLAARDGGDAKLYLINTTDDKLSTIDEGNADFQLIGWSGQQFIYTVNRHTPNSWDDKRQALKSFNAQSNKLTTLDQTIGTGSDSFTHAYEVIQSTYILDNQLVYTKTWQLSQHYLYPPLWPVKDKKLSIISIRPDGENRQKHKEIDAQGMSVEARLYAPQEIYFRISQIYGPVNYYEYEEGKLAATNSTNDEKYYSGRYPTYLVSPSGQRTFWYEPRDGKNTLLVGDKDGEDSREITTLSEYVPYGWFSDEYVLVSKAGSELYILSRENPTSAPIKIVDYHKPGVSYPGYGYGYGGQ